MEQHSTQAYLPDRDAPAPIQPRRKALLLILLLCVGGITINLVGIRISRAMSLPLLFDSVGTVLVAAVGGYLPAIAVGFLTNIFAGIADLSAAYYGSLNVLIAVCTPFFIKRGWLKKLPRILGVIAVFALIEGGLGSVLTWLLNGMSADAGASTELSRRILAQGGLSLFWSQFCANVLIDLTDKSVAVCLAALLLRRIPASLITLLNSYGWQQTPLSDEEKAAASRSYSRAMSLRSKILLLIAVATLLTATAATTISYILYSRATLDEQTLLGQRVANLAASVIDGDRIADFIVNGENAEGYRETEDRLYRIRSSSPSIEFIYVYKITYEGCLVVFDLDTAGLAGEDPGTLIGFDDAFLPYLPALYAGKNIDPIISDETYGWLLTAYSPVYDSHGVCQCYAAADISMQTLTAGSYAFVARVVSMFFGFFVFVLALGLWIAEYNITLPINTISLAAGSFAYDSEEARKQNVARIHSLGIHTGDEIEHLYTAFEKTTEDTVRYISDAQEKSEEIAKLQSGLILVLADIVESRDLCTGNHIRKTAAYAEIIMEQMRADGIYAGQLTDQYISDVVQSAPLHDIGKIQVPDAVLNKPGPLNDEEYALMKTHASAGRDIISRAIAIVPNGSGYLDEARNLAAFHHERWDGSGYPTGLSGEDIPLSARIMAVADVFDALVSRRSYKEPFSVESAMAIIQEGSGSHFDPQIVTAFLHAEDKIRHMAELHLDEPEP